MTQKLMTAPTAARKLEDILKWKNQLHPTYQTVQAIRYDGDKISGSSERGLEFGLDHVVDSTTTGGTDHPGEITTSEGADKWLRFWNPWMTYWASLPNTYRQTPGPLFLQQLQENPVFRTITSWDEDDQAAWEEFTTELHTVWARLRTLTGNKPLVRSLCPKCQKGNLQSPPGQNGYTDQATCSNRDCQTTIDYNTEEHTTSIRAAMRAQDIPPDRYLTIDQIKTIWPRTKTSTLRKRVERGTIRKKGHLYNLADINTWKTGTKHDTVTLVDV